jgi:Kef-type K+ transport system membrane component KefB
MSSDAATIDTQRPAPSVWKLALAYAAMIAAAIALFFLVRSYGDGLVSRGGATKAAATTAKSDVLMHLLLALVAIILLGRWLGKLFLHFGQPRVIGEMVAGIVLGPSVLGDWSVYVLPSTVAPALSIIAQLGVILYMFLVGLELNSEPLKARAHATVAISHASIVTPFLLGAVLALWLFEPLAPAGRSFTSFALFMGVAMSITAFPVLARILTDRGIDKTELGVVALSCAAIDDVTAWCLLAFVVGVTQAEVGGAVQTIVLALIYIAAMLLVMRPIAVRYFGEEAHKHPQRRMAVWVLVSLLMSALAAEWIGIHAIFGAFLWGAIIPHDSDVARDFRAKLEDIVKILLLPAFFAYTGMRTEIGLVTGWQAWFICGVIILVATLGKFGGTLVAGRATGLSWRMAASLGVLMNTRGLMELIVLNVGLDLGVISPELFAMMVIMALATTIATTPLLRLMSAARPNSRGLEAT